MTAVRSSILALGAKVVVGGAVVAMAAGVATTGTANPVSMGQRIVQVVERCRDEIRASSTSGDRGIGECVSDVAQEHGQQMRSQHSEAAESSTAVPSPKPGLREGQNGQSTAAANANHGQGRDGSPATPSTADHRATGHDDHGHSQPSPSASPR